MPPKKKSTGPPAAPLPAPNASHPCAALLPAALSPSSLADRPHSASYHAFLRSPFYPTPSSKRDTSPPPAKRKKKAAAEDVLPPLLETAIDAAAVQRKLLAWFDTVKDTRGMPWRKEVNPAQQTDEERAQRAYEVWVSEIMLQQTQVVTVVGYWTRWMAKFPTVELLAKADIEEVNEVWKGLGYYSRAKRLLDGAKTVVDNYDGHLPSTAEELLGVDGIGPYTAGAVSSIAFAQRSPLVDGNVQRVLSRLTALHAPQAAKQTSNFVWALADALVPAQPSPSSSSSFAADPDPETDPTSSPHFKRRRPSSKRDDLSDVGGPNKPGAWNQALMELGATVCTPKNPKCGECPLSEECLAYAEARYVAHRPSSASSSSSTAAEDIEDLCTLCSPLPYDTPSEAKTHNVEVYPMAKVRAKKREEETAVCVVEWVPEGTEGEGEEGRKVLLVKRPEKGLLAGLYEFPAVDLPPSDDPSTAFAGKKHLTALLSSLLSSPSLPAAVSSSSSDETGKHPLILVSRTALPVVSHTYSHMIRTYHPERLVLSSPSSSGPPALHTADSAPRPKGADKDLARSRPGFGKWVDASAVEGQNLGGAVGKVWEERQAVVSGKGGGSSGGGGAKKGKKAPSAAAAKGKKEKEAAAEKGQGSLLGFFGKKMGVVKVEEEKKARKEASAEDDDDDDDVIVVEEETKVKVVEKKVYKKRRTAPSSDEEDD
ncbi:hypothetical protein JCM8097_008279 [Rhodosporidiobolus ruineniae]